MIRPDLAAKFDELVNRAAAIASTARQSVQSADVCESFWFGDEGACAALLWNAKHLEDAVVDLRQKVEAIVSSSEPVSESTIANTEQLAKAIHGWGAEIVDVATMAMFDDLSRDVFAEYRQWSMDAAAAIGEGAGRAVGGFLGGLGPIGLLIIVVVAVVVIRGRVA